VRTYFVPSLEISKIDFFYYVGYLGDEKTNWLTLSMVHPIY
jgi:hypothetical protein